MPRLQPIISALAQYAGLCARLGAAQCVEHRRKRGLRLVEVRPAVTATTRWGPNSREHRAAPTHPRQIRCLLSHPRFPSDSGQRYLRIFLKKGETDGTCNVSQTPIVPCSLSVGLLTGHSSRALTRPPMPSTHTFQDNYVADPDPFVTVTIDGTSVDSSVDYTTDEPVW